ncbi:MAG TPA: hypothetical protein DIT07_10180 [Sphingobacteriaceae bacterium]|nr:hypothetical protein [Sphingobacteriaceae bacterium]
MSFSKAQGGPQGTPAERAAAALERPALASLSLTADQKAKTVALLTKLNTSSDSLMATANGDFQSVMPKRIALAAPYEAKFVSWLTADQKKAYDTALAAMKEQNPNATGLLGGRGGRLR